jgi:hypothetical protein
VAEVKAILRAYIGRVDYAPETNRARVGFLRMPTRALVSRLAPESARISMVAGARFLIYPRPPAGGRLPLSGGLLVPFTWCREGVFDVE